MTLGGEGGLGLADLGASRCLLTRFYQTDEGVEHFGVGDGDVVLGGGADYGSVDGVDFGAAVGEDVLQHGGLVAGVGFE